MKEELKDGSIPRRPRQLEDVYQTTNLTHFQTMIDEDSYPSFMILSGPPGTGKTTVARILAAHILKLEGDERERLIDGDPNLHVHGFVEKDFTREGKADDVNELVSMIAEESRSGIGLMGPSPTVIILDEFDSTQATTQKKIAKPIEDIAVNNVHIIAIVNDEGKVNDAIMSRAFVNGEHRYIFKYFTREMATRYIKDQAKILGNRTLDAGAIRAILDTSHEFTPRVLKGKVTTFLKNGSVAVETVGETYAISEIVKSVNSIANHRVLYLSTLDTQDKISREDYRKVVNTLVTGLYQSVYRLAQMKSSYEACVLGFSNYFKYYIEDEQFAYNKYDVLMSFSVYMKHLNYDHSKMSYSYPTMSLMTALAQVIDEKVSKELNIRNIPIDSETSN